MIRPYRVEDWRTIVDAYQAEFLSLRDGQAVDRGPAYTYEHYGIPIAAGGVCPYWPGVGLGWIIASPEMRQHPLWLGSFVTRVFWEHLAPAFWRIEATARLDRPESHRLLVKLGFRPEGVARQYGPDRSDFLRFAWVRST